MYSEEMQIKEEGHQKITGPDHQERELVDYSELVSLPSSSTSSSEEVVEAEPSLSHQESDSGFVFDPDVGLYYNPSMQMYYEWSVGIYLDPKSLSW